MYRPPHFREERREILHAAMAGIGFAALVSQSLDATQMPLLLDANDGELGTLSGHMARANPHWKNAAGEGLAIFLGPHAYVSPNWYPSKAETGKAVPTWNYITVHARGPIRWIQDADWLRAQVTALSAHHEGPRPDPWKVEDASAGYIDGLVRAIVGFELTIQAIEGKYKLSQNRPEVDQQGVRDAFTREGRDDIARLMK